MPKIVGNLFAKAALHDVNHDLALPGAQRFKALPELTQGLLTLVPGAIAIEASRYGLVRNSMAPPFIACTDIGISPCPVMKMIGSWMFAAASSR
jgi:hypothetical protein